MSVGLDLVWTTSGRSSPRQEASSRPASAAVSTAIRSRALASSLAWGTVMAAILPADRPRTGSSPPGSRGSAPPWSRAPDSPEPYYPVLGYPVLGYPVLGYPALGYPVLGYPERCRRAARGAPAPAR